ncbi:uncharacterized protein [Clytia hemisphaerica]|uniref:Cnidarian restricted protein n=1 Tax=Clytia hemisphaerica TaxID=252671 RepID=A0A7M5TZM7_9CNID
MFVHVILILYPLIITVNNFLIDNEQGYISSQDISIIKEISNVQSQMNCLHKCVRISTKVKVFYNRENICICFEEKTGNKNIVKRNGDELYGRIMSVIKAQEINPVVNGPSRIMTTSQLTTAIAQITTTAASLTITTAAQPKITTTTAQLKITTTTAQLKITTMPFEVLRSSTGASGSFSLISDTNLTTCFYTQIVDDPYVVFRLNVPVLEVIVTVIRPESVISLGSSSKEDFQIYSFANGNLDKCSNKVDVHTTTPVFNLTCSTDDVTKAFSKIKIVKEEDSRALMLCEIAVILVRSVH